MNSSMPFFRPLVDPRKGFDLRNFRAALTTLQPLAQYCKRAIPTDFRSDDAGLADAPISAAKANDRQAVVAEFLAELPDFGGAHAVYI
jgi:hypothetical protein